MTNTQKILEFDDYFFEATQGRNDVRREKITSVIHQAIAEERDRVVGMIGEDEMAISQSSMNSGRMSKQEAFIVEIRNKFRTELKAKIKDSQPTY